MSSLSHTRKNTTIRTQGTKEAASASSRIPATCDHEVVTVHRNVPASERHTVTNKDRLDLCDVSRDKGVGV